MFIHSDFETHFVHIKSLLARNVARDLKGQAIGSIQIKGAVPIQDGGLNTVKGERLVVAQPVEQILQMSVTSFNRPREADLLPRQIIENRATALRQFRIK